MELGMATIESVSDSLDPDPIIFLHLDWTPYVWKDETLTQIL